MALVAQAQAQVPMPALAGAPADSTARPDAGPSDAPPDAGHAKECYAKVKFGAQYGLAPLAGQALTLGLTGRTGISAAPVML
jgi:hypothetical protein